MAISKQVGIVAGLWRYPVKSMLGEQLAELEISERGAVGDRAYALRELATQRIVSGKKFAALFEFRAAYEERPSLGRFAPVAIRLPDGRTIHAEDADASEHIGAVVDAPCPRGVESTSAHARS